MLNLIEIFARGSDHRTCGVDRAHEHANGSRARWVHDRPEGDGLLAEAMAWRAWLSRRRTRAGQLTMRRNHFIGRSALP